MLPIIMNIKVDEAFETNIFILRYLSLRARSRVISTDYYFAVVALLTSMYVCKPILLQIGLFL